MKMTNEVPTKKDYTPLLGQVDVLDQGYVRLDDFMGNDLSVVNAARVSYEKKNSTGVMTPGDEGLVRFLVREDHMSPFRHAMLKFEFKAPLMVARQHWKYVVGSDHAMDGWNEASRRYVTSKEQFYVPGPDQWRSAPENSKQGSGDPVDLEIGNEAFIRLMDVVTEAEENYAWALENGICAEQARLFLPSYGLYVHYIWTASLQSVIHFLKQRLAHDAQVEIQQYAQAVHKLSAPLFPVTFQAFNV